VVIKDVTCVVDEVKYTATHDGCEVRVCTSIVRGIKRPLTDVADPFNAIVEE
jgi:hypothetical protein